ncbi:MAG: DUF554 domain-containing protein [Cyanobacteria bacterium P01_A01_bin.83]
MSFYFNFWHQTSGTWINIFTVLIGTSLGLLLRGYLSPNIQTIITQGIGLLTVWIGLNMADSMMQVQVGEINGAVLGLIAIILGGVAGELLQIESKLTALGEWLKQRFRGKDLFTEGFVASSLLFCIGPMTLIGSLNNGLTGDNTLLILKATMDGLVAIPLANIYGVGVGFSTIVILAYQGGLSLVAGSIANILPSINNNPYLLLITGIGGLMIMAIGFNLLELVKIRVASFLPALIVSPFIYWLALYLSNLA